MPDHQAQELPVRLHIPTGPYIAWLICCNSLAAVNFFLGTVGTVQLSRIFLCVSLPSLGLLLAMLTLPLGTTRN